MESSIQTDKKSDEEIKQKILEESFKKASFNQDAGRKTIKKTDKNIKKRNISKIGLILIFISIISIIIIYFGPWAFIQYTADYGSDNVLIFSNTKNIDINSKDISDLFRSNRIGIGLGDFQNGPYTTSAGFVFLIILGLLFLMFQLVDQFKNFSYETFAVITSLFAVFTVIFSIFIIYTMMKFIGSYFLLIQNMHLINFTPIIIYINPFIIIFIGFIISKYAYSMIKIYYKQLKSKNQSEDTKYSFFKSSIGESK